MTFYLEEEQEQEEEEDQKQQNKQTNNHSNARRQTRPGKSSCQPFKLLNKLIKCSLDFGFTTHLLGIFIQDRVVVEALEAPFRIRKVIFVVWIPGDEGDPERVGLVLDVNSNAFGSAILKEVVSFYASHILLVEELSRGCGVGVVKLLGKQTGQFC